MKHGGWSGEHLENVYGIVLFVVVYLLLITSTAICLTESAHKVAPAPPDTYTLV